jgi:hypothetical protein
MLMIELAPGLAFRQTGASLETVELKRFPVRMQSLDFGSVLHVHTQFGNQVVDFPAAIEMFGVDSGHHQIEVIGFTIGIHFYSHRQVRRQRTLTTFRKKTAFNDVSKFQGRKKHYDPLLNVRMPIKHPRRSVLNSPLMFLAGFIKSSSDCFPV